MAKINLLPWREERRQELQRQFIVVLVGVAIVGALAVFAVDNRVNAKIEEQQARNRFIQDETKKLDESIREIKELRKQRDRLIARMEVIQNLQGNRSFVVHVFDEMARTVPDGVYLSEIKKTGNSYEISGAAEANNRVSNYMRNLDKSDWFKDPNLSEVKANQKDEAAFRLSVKESVPGKSEEGDS